MSNNRPEYYSGLEVVPPEAPQALQQHFVNDPSQAPQVLLQEKSPLYAEDCKPDGSIPPLTDVETAKDNATSKGKILGLRRTTFWLVLLIVILIIGGAVGGGVGATMGKNKKSESSSSASAVTDSAEAYSSHSPLSTSSTTNTATTATHTTSMTTVASSSQSTSSSSSTSTSTASPPNAQAVVAGCPGVNNTIYTASTGRDRFLKICALEMPGPAIDITSYNTTTFDACIDKCAQLNFDTRNSTCVAVTWDLRAFDYKICYLKHTIGAWRPQGDEDSYLVTSLLVGR